VALEYFGAVVELQIPNADSLIVRGSDEPLACRCKNQFTTQVYYTPLLDKLDTQYSLIVRGGDEALDCRCQCSHNVTLLKKFTTKVYCASIKFTTKVYCTRIRLACRCQRSHEVAVPHDLALDLQGAEVPQSHAVVHG